MFAASQNGGPSGPGWVSPNAWIEARYLPRLGLAVHRLHDYDCTDGTEALCVLIGEVPPSAEAGG